MYESIPSLTILPRAIPGDSHVLTVPGVGFSPNFLCPAGGVRGFEFEKFSTVRSERNMQELLDLIQRNQRQLEKQVFLFCFISIFAKTLYVYCIFNNIDRFRPFRSF